LKVLVQRVAKASVSVDGNIIGCIDRGLVALVGVANGDNQQDVNFLTEKTVNLRIFEDNQGKFNLSLLDIKGELLIVSQFTLLADARKGRRPSFTDAAPPELAKKLIDNFVDLTREYGIKVATGRFQAHMMVEIYNDGPVTILLESKDNRQDPYKV